jgi:hypothetical protein
VLEGTGLAHPCGSQRQTLWPQAVAFRLRYCARPPFALERLELIDEQQVIYRLPRTQRDGTTALSLTPLELIDHLAALIPPPRRHRHRYHGVLAPNSPLHAAAVAFGRDAADDLSACAEANPPSAAPLRNMRSPVRYLWAMLLARLFESTPDWDIIAQPDPGFAFDQRVSW